MSVAYFIVLDKEDVGFDTFVNGKALARVFDELSAFCEKHQLKTIEDFHSQDASEYLEDFDDVEMPEQEVLWFSAEEGIEWANALLEKIHLEKPSFASEAVIAELNEYLEVYLHCKDVGAKWHLELDV